MMKYRVSTSRSSNISSLLHGRFTIKVVLLDNTEVSFKFEERKKILGSELFEKVCKNTKIEEPWRKYFGLQYVNKNDGKRDWLKKNQVVNQCPSSVPGQFQFAVKVFPDTPSDEDQVVQKLLVFQVKEYLLLGNLRTTIQEQALLDSYFAQGTLGNFNQKKHFNGYLEKFLGSFFCNSFSEMSKNLYEQKVQTLHKSHQGMAHCEAFKAFLSLSASIFGYGTFVYKRAVDMNGKEFILTVSFKGIQIFLPNIYGEPEELVQEFPWDTVVSFVSDSSKFLFSVCSAHKSLQTHSFRFKGQYGYLQANRVFTDAVYHRDLILALKSIQEREPRSKSLKSENSARLERLLPGRGIDKMILMPTKKTEV
ncbi:radixin-like [Actinia tenebrosa]|uniref:Radixin-like n=1 Tax=Actinia tenebrosa TaxID=6105 RepID=A0A6P8HZS2_ACTTE|nr:radixin-like [Actinia tenebrosa]